MTETPTAPPTNDARRDRFTQVMAHPASGATIIVVGVLFTVAVMAWGFRTQAPLDRLHRVGVDAPSIVSAIEHHGAPAGTICASSLHLATDHWCLEVDDPGSFHVGQDVTVRYDPGVPSHALVVGHERDVLGTAFPWLLGGLFVVLCGAYFLADARALARGDSTKERGNWVGVLALGGLATWAGFAFISLWTKRWRWLGWAVLYLVGITIALVLALGHPRRLPLALVCWLAVWVGGLAHGLIIVPVVNERRAQVVERLGSERQPLPPPPTSAGSAVPVSTARLDVAVEMPFPQAEGTPPIDGPLWIHATRLGEPVCGSESVHLVPTYRRWPQTGANAARRCPECTSLVGPRPPARGSSRSGADATDPGAPTWTGRHPDDFWATLLVWATAVLWIQVLLAVAAFNPDDGGSLALGFPVLIANLVLTIWVFARIWRRRVTFRPDGIERVGLRRTRFIPWTSDAYFSEKAFVASDGESIRLPSRFLAERSAPRRRATSLNDAFGFVAPLVPRLPAGLGLVELPDLSERRSTERAARSGVLHAQSPTGGPLCDDTRGPVLPNFAHWRDQDLGCLQLCTRCASLRRPRSRTFIPHVPLIRPPRPRPGRECTIACTRAESWGIVAVWVVCGLPYGLVVTTIQLGLGHYALAMLALVFLAAPGIWVLWRLLGMSTTFGSDGIVVRGFWRTRTWEWFEVREYSRTRSGNTTNLRGTTLKNHTVKLWTSWIEIQKRVDVQRLADSLNRVSEAMRGQAPTHT